MVVEGSGVGKQWLSMTMKQKHNIREYLELETPDNIKHDKSLLKFQ